MLNNQNFQSQYPQNQFQQNFQYPNAYSIIGGGLPQNPGILPLISPVQPIQQRFNTTIKHGLIAYNTKKNGLINCNVIPVAFIEFVSNGTDAIEYFKAMHSKVIPQSQNKALDNMYNLTTVNNIESMPKVQFGDNLQNINGVVNNVIHAALNKNSMEMMDPNYDPFLNSDIKNIIYQQQNLNGMNMYQQQLKNNIPRIRGGYNANKRAILANNQGIINPYNPYYNPQQQLINNPNQYNQQFLLAQQDNSIPFYPAGNNMIQQPLQFPVVPSPYMQVNPYNIMDTNVGLGMGMGMMGFTGNEQICY